MRIFLLWLLLLAGACRAAPPVFAPVTPGHTLAFPRDYGAHPDFRTEWWYVTGWLTTPDGKPLGFQVTFFRSRSDHDTANPSAFAPHQLVIGHAAISDPSLGRLVHDQRSARAGFGLAWAKPGDTDVKLDDWRMLRGADGNYRVSVRSGEMTLELTLSPTQPPLPQGEAGYSRKGAGARHASYYYSLPQLRVSGRAGRAGKLQTVTGSAWFDHEWSSEALDADASGWDWIGANLGDGSALTAFQVRSKDGAKLWAYASLRARDGKLTRYGPGDVAFTPRGSWRSPRTNAAYPVATTVTIGGTRWQIDPLQSDQELDSRRSTGAVYWEGAVTVAKDGKQAGRGYLEMTGYVRPMKL